MERKVRTQRRVRSEDPGASKSFIENTLDEIRRKDQSTEKLSSEEIDQLLGVIRRSRSTSVDIVRSQSQTRGGVRPPPPQFTPPPLPQDSFLPFGPGRKADAKGT